MMRRLIGLAVALAVFALGAGAAAAQATWNSGYGWWPGGFGYPPVTVHAPYKYPCSVTAYGPTFRSYRSGWVMYYGGGTSCTKGIGVKTLTVSAQVLGRDGHTWHTITGSTLTKGPTTDNPVRIISHRRAHLGHAYRTVAKAKLVVPFGYAGCSLKNDCYRTFLITAISRWLAP